MYDIRDDDEKVELNNEVDRESHVADSGHIYELHNVDSNSVQQVRFIKKEPDDQGNFKTVMDGTTNEAVLQMLIHRIYVLDGKMHSQHNVDAVHHLEQALTSLMERTKDRKEREVEGTNKE